MNNQTSLTMYNGTIRMIFEGEEPLTRDNVGIYQMGNQGLRPSPLSPLLLSIEVLVSSQHAIMESTQRLPKEQTYERKESQL